MEFSVLRYDGWKVDILDMKAIVPTRQSTLNVNYTARSFVELQYIAQITLHYSGEKSKVEQDVKSD